jgi:dGTPase
MTHGLFYSEAFVYSFDRSNTAASAENGSGFVMSGLSWARLLSERRLPKKPVGEASDQSISADEDIPPWIVPSRTETERDFDRVLFATPTRRLGDKTQVFPLEKNESVRTRLTHSHEVANLARSIGTYLAGR